MLNSRPSRFPNGRFVPVLVGAAAAIALTVSACGSATPEEVATELQSAAQQAGEAGQSAADGAGNVLDDAGNAVSEVAQDGGSGGGIGGGDAGGGDAGGGGGDIGGGGGDTGGGNVGGGNVGGGDTGGANTGGDTTGIPATDPNTGSADSTPWWLFAIMLGLVGLLIGFILRGNRRREREPVRHETAPVGPAPHDSASDALSTAQWVVDDLAIDITNPQAPQPQQRMASASPRLDDAHIAFISHYNETGNELWNELARELSSTRSGLEQYAQIVSQPQFDQNTAQQASQVVNQHRSALNSLIQQGWNALRAQR